jgi:hypothetical protein
MQSPASPQGRALQSINLAFAAGKDRQAVCWPRRRPALFTQDLRMPGGKESIMDSGQRGTSTTAFQFSLYTTLAHNFSAPASTGAVSF